VSPVPDPKAFAAKIEFGTVNSVQGRTITMAADKIEGLPGPDADGVTRALFDLKSSSVHKRQVGLRKLKEAIPDDRRTEVCKVLEPLINDADHVTHVWAVEALGVWGTKETVPVLLKAMNDKEDRDAAMKALGRLKDERAIEPIAQRLEEFFDRMAATEALQNMGPIAEEAVLKRLNHHDVQVGWAVCDILKAIGTKKSLPALEKVVAGSNLAMRQKAKDAMQAITARQ
jgi:HEAT repeat protein